MGIEENMRSKRLSDVFTILAFLGVSGTVATIVAATVVIGGGGFLLLISPLLLLFSPILVPLAIIGTLLVGGFIVVAGGTALAASIAVWLYRYFRGARPAGAEQVDYVKSSVGETFGYVQEKATAGIQGVAQGVSQSVDYMQGTAMSGLTGMQQGVSSTLGRASELTAPARQSEEQKS